MAHSTGSEQCVHTHKAYTHDALATTRWCLRRHAAHFTDFVLGAQFPLLGHTEGPRARFVPHCANATRTVFCLSGGGFFRLSGLHAGQGRASEPRVGGPRGLDRLGFLLTCASVSPASPPSPPPPPESAMIVPKVLFVKFCDVRRETRGRL